jgi:predicted nuclease of predicted toxin-antitoxin system
LNGQKLMDAPYCFLFDECMTPTLRSVAKEFGHFGLHVDDLKRHGDSDAALAVLARDRNYVMVTNNRIDFLRLYKRFELHSGLIVVVPSVAKALQRLLFAAALQALRTRPDIVNKLIEVDADGNVTFIDWPPPLSNTPDI